MAGGAWVDRGKGRNSDKGMMDRGWGHELPTETVQIREEGRVEVASYEEGQAGSG